MKWSERSEGWFREYADAVWKAAGNGDESRRREWERNLREELEERLAEGREAAGASDAEVAAALSGMESPEAVAAGMRGEAAGEGSGAAKTWGEARGPLDPAAGGGRGGGGGWARLVFGLLLGVVLGLLGARWQKESPKTACDGENAGGTGEAVKVVQSGGAEWIATEGDTADDPSGGTGTAAPQPPPEPARLKLVSLSQVDVSVDNEVSLSAVFNHPVTLEELQRHLRFRDAAGRPVHYTAREAHAWERHGWSGKPAWVARIETAPLEGAKLGVELDAGLKAAPEGILSLEEGLAEDLDIHTDLGSVQVEAQNHPWSGRELELTFPLRVDPDELQRHLRIEPPVALGDIDGSWSSLTVAGDFREMQAYQITLTAGLRANCGVTLEEDVGCEVRFGHGEPEFRVKEGGRNDELYLSPRGSRRVAVWGYGVDGVKVEVRPLREAGLAEWASTWRRMNNRSDDLLRPSRFGEVWFPRGVQGLADDEPWEGEEAWIDLNDYADADGGLRGLYELVVHGLRKNPDGSVTTYHTGDRRLLNVTDTALHADWGDNQALVWAHSLRDGEPRAGVRVTAWGRGREALAEGETGADGLVHLRWTEDDEREHGRPVLVTACDGDDLAALLLEWNILSLDGVEGAHFVDDANHIRLEEAPEAFLWSDRGIYRHGETIHWRAVARDASGKAPPEQPAQLRVRECSRWNVLATIPVMLGPDGGTGGEIEVPGDWPSGRLELCLEPPGGGDCLGQLSLQVENFVAPQIRVDVEKVPDVPRGMASMDVRAAYLFGKEAATLRYRVGWGYHDAAFAPKEWEGWTFGDALRPFSPVWDTPVNGVLEPDGTTRVETSIPATLRPGARVRVTCEAMVFEESGRAVRGFAETVLDPVPRYIGLRGRWDGTAPAGGPAVVEVVQVAPDGKPDPAAAPLLIQLYRRSWTSAARVNRAGRYEWTHREHRELVAEGTVPGGAETQTWSFEPPATGAYLLCSRDPATGAETTLAFAAARDGEEAPSAAAPAPEKLRLSWTHRGTVAPGGTAKLRVEAPFAGWALATLESSGILWSEVVKLDAGANAVKIPVPEDADRENYIVGVALVRPVRGEREWNAHRLVARTLLPVAHSERSFKVSLRAPKLAKPQERLRVGVTVKDSAGNPAPGALVTVSAVDEGICMLTAWESPDPLAWLRRARRNALSWNDAYGNLMREDPDAPESDAAIAAGGGAAARSLRNRLNPIRARRYKPAAFWSGVLSADENGCATADFDLPEFSGELRLSAVAWDAGRLGSAHRAATVRRDWVVQSAFPRFLACGDDAEVPVTLHNAGPEPKRLVARLSCGGPLSCDAAEQSAEVPAGGRAVLRFRLHGTAEAGTGSVRFEVTDAAGKDAYREDFELAVRPVGGTRRVAQFARLAPGESVELAAPADWVPVSVAGGVTATADPGLEAREALEYVTFYPHGCLEQTVSGALPWIGNPDRLGGKALSTSVADPRSRVVNAVRRISRMQLRSGAFSMWPGGGNADIPASFYAIQFLLAAREDGCGEAAKPLEEAQGWLRGMLRNPLPTGEDRWWRANAALLLAQMGQEVESSLLELSRDTLELDAPTRALLAAAWLRAGNPQRAMGVLQTVDLSGPLDGGDWCGVLRAPERTLAVLLDAWLDLSPDSPQVREILGAFAKRRGENSHWGSTQANACALFAHGRAAALLDDERKPFALDAAGTVLPEGLSASREWNRGTLSGGALRVENKGPGEANAWLQLSGISLDPEPPSERGIRVEREFLDLDGNPIDPSSMEQGELFIVQITLHPERWLDNVVIEERLPAGWEVENPNLATSQKTLWQVDSSKRGSEVNRDLRDDALYVFTGAIWREARYAYSVRAVTPGRYALPGTVVEAMYDPDVRAVGKGGEVRVVVSGDAAK